ncbi:MAG: GlxA family transcriptional regulator [Myxococcota bacterium]
MAEREKLHRIGILIYPRAQMSAVLGLTDLFEMANRVSAELGAPSANIDVQHWRADDGPTTPDAPLTALIVPPSLDDQAPEDDDELDRLAAWTINRHGEGTVVCSVCVGAFLLARTGLLSGRVVTTHWALADRFAEDFPEIELDTDKLLIDDGDIITAGGLMAWTDLGLKLIDRLLGSAITLATARYFLVDPGGREQRFYSSFAPKLSHGDSAILKVQHWLATTSDEKITLPAMAGKAGLGERTFLRRFHRATGLKPIRYLQQLRVGKARGMLELSSMTVDEIAWKVGYEDTSAFRKLFKRIMGLSPGEYRRRFAV